MAVVGEAVCGIITNIAAGASALIQPPSDEQWIITEVGLGGSWAWIGIDIGDGTNWAAVRRGGTGLNYTLMDQKPLRVYLTNSLYMRIRNVHATVTYHVFYSGFCTKKGGTAVRGDAKSAVQSLAAAATMTIQPPAGETWGIHELASSGWQNDSNGEAAPDIDARIHDASNFVQVGEAASGQLLARTQRREWRLGITNSNYLQLTNGAASTQVLGYTGVRTK